MSGVLDDGAPSDALDPLALLAAAAGDRPLPQGTTAELDEMVEIALVAASARRSRRTRWRTGLSMAAAALLSFGVGASMTTLGSPHGEPSREAEPSPAHAISELTLPTGDRIVRLGPGSLDIVQNTARGRRFSVSEGQVLFDVVPLREGERFEVTTPHLRATVVGTVFAVEVEPEGTRLQVFDGRVRVRWADDRELDVGRGQSFDSRTGVAPRAWRSGLFDEGRSAARRHASRRAASPEPGLEAPETAAPDAEQPNAEPPNAADSAHTTASGEPTRRRAVDAPARALGRPPATLAMARGWLADGETELALEAAAHACAATPNHGGWQLLRADTLRARGRFAAAAEAYDVAARSLPPSRATAAGYLAAHLRLSELADPDGALRALERTGAAEPGSPMEERAVALTIRAHQLAGHRSDAEASARRYLARFPGGSSRAWVEQILSHGP